ncbi:unnamed protein product, partial [Rotaria magnacalcarata]
YRRLLSNKYYDGTRHLIDCHNCNYSILKDVYWHSDEKLLEFDLLYTLLYNSEFDLISLINQTDARNSK